MRQTTKQQANLTPTVTGLFAHRQVAQIAPQRLGYYRLGHSPTGAPAPAKPRPFLHPPAPVKRPNDRGVFAGFSYFY